MNKKKTTFKEAFTALVDRFLNFFKKKKVSQLLNPNENISVRVYRIDEESPYMHSALGITEERAAQIGRMIGEQFNKNNNCAVGVMEVISKDLKHPNEVVLATWIMKCEIDKMKSPMAAGGFMRFIIEDIVEDIKKRRKSKGDDKGSKGEE